MCHYLVLWWLFHLLLSSLPPPLMSSSSSHLLLLLLSTYSYVLYCSTRPLLLRSYMYVEYPPRSCWYTITHVASCICTPPPFMFLHVACVLVGSHPCACHVCTHMRMTIHIGVYDVLYMCQYVYVHMHHSSSPIVTYVWTTSPIPTTWLLCIYMYYYIAYVIIRHKGIHVWWLPMITWYNTTYIPPPSHYYLHDAWLYHPPLSYWSL